MNKIWASDIEKELIDRVATIELNKIIKLNIHFVISNFFYLLRALLKDGEEYNHKELKA